jgi:hypothetical protein
MPQQLDEALDTRVPEALVIPEPMVGALERPRIDAAVMDAPTDGTFHEARALEGLNVLRRRGKGHAVRRGELAHGLLALGESLEHGPPCVVAEGTKDEVESIGTFNHIVEYCSRCADCQPFG